MEGTANNREERIQHAMDFLSDMFPWGSPNYEDELREAAENYVDWEDAGCPMVEHDWLNDLYDEDIDLPF